MNYALLFLSIAILGILVLFKVAIDEQTTRYDTSIETKSGKIERLIEERDDYRAESDYWRGQVYQLSMRAVWCQAGYMGDRKAYLAELLDKQEIKLDDVLETAVIE